MATSPNLINSTTRHQVFLERLKSGEANKFGPFFVAILTELTRRLARSELTVLGRARTERLLMALDAALSEVYTDFRRALIADAIDIANAEARFAARELDVIFDRNAGFESVIPGRAQVRAAVLSSPLSVRGPGGGKLLEPWLRGWSRGQVEMVTGVIRQGFFEGQTNAAMIRTLRDSTLDVSKRSAEAVVRTAVQHVASAARMETLKENDDVVTGYRWIATLDQRTCLVCAPLDNTVQKFGEGPVPPLHPQCRCAIAPELDGRFAFLDEGATRSAGGAKGFAGPVDAKETYFSWLKKQPAAFQDAAIGPKRAALLRDGGLSAERFARLNLHRNFEPMTLADMRRLEPLAFERAGLN
jgi:SPP1 gp7 family putative phage head morphogenesis protein